MKVMRHWNRFPRGVGAPPLEVFNGTLGSLEVFVRCSFEQPDREIRLDDFWFLPTQFYICMILLPVITDRKVTCLLCLKTL